MPYLVLSGTVWGIFTLQSVRSVIIVSIVVKLIVVAELYIWRCILVTGTLGRLSGVCAVHIVAYGVVFDGYCMYILHFWY